MEQILAPIILAIVIALVLFLVFRAVLLWYWKVTDILYNQEVTNQLLREQNNLLKQVFNIDQIVEKNVNSQNEINESGK